MQTTRHIFLVGARASGKTTVGQALARLLDCPWQDTDALLVRSLGMSVADFVAAEGWPAFREAESRVLHALCDAPPAAAHGAGTNPQDDRAAMVISTGGGMVLRADNRQCMRTAGTVFYLQAPVALMVERLRRDPNVSQRPSLGSSALPVSLEEEVVAVLREREPLYREAAHMVLDAGLPPEALASQMREYLQQNS